MLRPYMPLQFVDDSAGDDGGCRAAFEGTPVEGGIAGLAGGFGGAEGPRAIERKNREVGGLAGSDGAFEAEDARGAGGKELDDTEERGATGVHELFEGEGQGGLETGNAERRAVVLDVFVDEREMMRSDLAGDAQAALLGPANLFERSFRGKMRDVQARAG